MLAYISSIKFHLGLVTCCSYDFGFKAKRVGCCCFMHLYFRPERVRFSIKVETHCIGPIRGSHNLILSKKVFLKMCPILLSISLFCSISVFKAISHLGNSVYNENWHFCDW